MVSLEYYTRHYNKEIAQVICAIPHDYFREKYSDLLAQRYKPHFTPLELVKMFEEIQEDLKLGVDRYTGKKIPTVNTPIHPLLVHTFICTLHGEKYANEAYAIIKQKINDNEMLTLENKLQKTLNLNNEPEYTQ